MCLAIRVRNYRALRHVDWSLPEGVSVLVGPNGSGKTTLLSVLASPSERVIRRSTIGHQFSRGIVGTSSLGCGSQDPVSVALEIDDLCWELEFSVRGASVDERAGERLTRGEEFILRREPFSDHLIYRGQDWPLPTGNGDRGDTRIALRRAYDDRGDADLEPLVTALTGSGTTTLYNLRKLITFGSQYSTDLYLLPSGENVFAVLRNWTARRDCRDRYQFVLDGLRDAFPDLCDDVEFEAAGQTVTVNVIPPGSEKRIPVRFAPNGWLAALLHLCAVAARNPEPSWRSTSSKTRCTRMRFEA